MSHSPVQPFDLVYARLLLYHLPERETVLRRLWDAVAPGGHLLIQDYDLRSVSVLPTLDSFEELRRVVVEAFSAAGCDVQIGARLPELFAHAGIGAPDGTDVSGRLEPLAEAQPMLTAVYRSLLSTAIAHGITTEQRAAATLSEVGRRRRALPIPTDAVAAADRRLEAQTQSRQRRARSMSSLALRRLAGAAGPSVVALARANDRSRRTVLLTDTYDSAGPRIPAAALIHTGTEPPGSSLRGNT